MLALKRGQSHPPVAAAPARGHAAWRHDSGDRVISRFEASGRLFPGRAPSVGLRPPFSPRPGNLLTLIVADAQHPKPFRRIDADSGRHRHEGAEIAIPRGRAEETCPVTALKDWLELAEITAGPLFRKVNRGGAVESARLSADGVRQILLKRAAAAGLKGTLAEPVSPHGLRAGFVTTAYRNGVPDEEIMGHTRHRSLTTMRSYVRRAKLSQASPAGKLGL